MFFDKFLVSASDLATSHELLLPWQVWMAIRDEPHVHVSYFVDMCRIFLFLAHNVKDT
jgi:hypothetical protein